MPTYRTLFYCTPFFLASMIPGAAVAVAPDECEQQRGQYPKEWNDVSKETPLFTCTSHYEGTVRITLGRPDEAGRRLMSLVRVSRENEFGPPQEVYRIWLDESRSAGCRRESTSRQS